MRLGFNPIDGTFDFRTPIENVVDSVNAISAKVVDQIALVDFTALKYQCQLTDGTNSRMFDLDVVYDGGGIIDVVSNRKGSLSIAVDVTISGPDMLLTITNNELSSIDLNFARLIL